MRAVVIHAAKDLRIEECTPETTGPGEVEVAIEAGGICGSACTTSVTAVSAPCGYASR